MNWNRDKKIKEKESNRERGKKVKTVLQLLEEKRVATGVKEKLRELTVWRKVMRKKR